MELGDIPLGMTHNYDSFSDGGEGIVDRILISFQKSIYHIIVWRWR
jgi:hypothetical protein